MRRASCSRATSATAGRNVAGRHHVPGRPLHGLHQDCRQAARGLALELLPRELHAEQATPGVRGAEGTVCAVGVGGDVRPRGKWAESVLEVAAHLSQGAGRLPMEAAPEGERLLLPGERPGKPHRALHGLGTPRVELKSREPGRRQVRHLLECVHAGLGGEGPGVASVELLVEGAQVRRVSVPESGYADARRQIEEAVSVDVDEIATLSPVDGDPRVRGDGLKAGSDALRLTLAQASATGSGHLRPHAGHTGGMAVHGATTVPGLMDGGSPDHRPGKGASTVSECGGGASDRLHR